MSLLKQVLLWKERIGSKGSKFFPVREDPASERRLKQYDYYLPRKYTYSPELLHTYFPELLHNVTENNSELLFLQINSELTIYGIEL